MKEYITELVSKYRWWILGAVVVVVVMLNNKGAADARVENASTTMETTT